MPIEDFPPCVRRFTSEDTGKENTTRTLGKEISGAAGETRPTIAKVLSTQTHTHPSFIEFQWKFPAAAALGKLKTFQADCTKLCTCAHSVVVTPHSDNPRNVETICERPLPKGGNENTNKMNDNKTEPDNLFSWTPYNYNREWSKLNMTGHDSSDEPSSDESSSDGYDSD